MQPVLFDGRSYRIELLIGHPTEDRQRQQNLAGVGQRSFSLVATTGALVGSQPVPEVELLLFLVPTELQGVIERFVELIDVALIQFDGRLAMVFGHGS